MFIVFVVKICKIVVKSIVVVKDVKLFKFVLVVSWCSKVWDQELVVSVFEVECELIIVEEIDVFIDFSFMILLVWGLVVICVFSDLCCSLIIVQISQKIGILCVVVWCCLYILK